MQLPYSNLRLQHWNPGATMPLTLPVHVICNTSDDDIHNNIRANSRLPKPWLKAAEAHDGVAVLCGSGPSLADTLPAIREWQEKGATVYAMNGAAKFLADNGVMPDIQVIIDARAATAQLLGPAKRHLFASQVHPSLFEACPDAEVWHLQIEGIEELFPVERPAHVQIGGAASVGNTATCLAYAMGFRQLEIYGYDSSHRNDKGHAFHQKMNDGDPTCSVTFRGKEYIASLTMRLQAEKFQATSKALVKLGCAINVHGDGLLPDIWNRGGHVGSEVDKYRSVWSIPGYRDMSPGELSAATFVDVVQPHGHVLDLGCGTGRGGLAIKARTDCQVTLVDFADNCRDQAATELPFVLANLSENQLPHADYGFCCDVMEHIPPKLVEPTIRNILIHAVPQCFFRIDFGDDEFGALIGETLHLSVHPYEWWLETFQRLGFLVPWHENFGRYGHFLVKRKTR